MARHYVKTGEAPKIITLRSKNRCCRTAVVAQDQTTDTPTKPQLTSHTNHATTTCDNNVRQQPALTQCNHSRMCAWLESSKQKSGFQTSKSSKRYSAQQQKYSAYMKRWIYSTW